MYLVEIVWNREFDWTPVKELDTLPKAEQLANVYLNSGDGARVKKAKITNTETGKIEWPSYLKAKKTP